MSGGKGGSQTATVEIPEWIEGPAKQNIARAQQVQQLGYMPYYGPDVAAFTPTQQAAFGSNIAAAEAFGLVPQGQLTAASGMPAPQPFTGGVRGYSTGGGLFNEAAQRLAARRPNQMAAYNQLFIDPIMDPEAVGGAIYNQNMKDTLAAQIAAGDTAGAQNTIQAVEAEGGSWDDIMASSPTYSSFDEAMTGMGQGFSTLGDSLSNLSVTGFLSDAVSDVGSSLTGGDARSDGMSGFSGYGEGMSDFGGGFTDGDLSDDEFSDDSFGW